jgi:ABC-type Fe3+-hydroxamate transport system substrate-binding protein
VAAAERIRAIRRTRAAVHEAARGRGSPDTVAVLDRSPLFVVGDATFLDEMLVAVGAHNLGAALGSGYPRGSIEWLIDARPGLLLDMTPDDEGSAAFWARWPSIPAVDAGRVVEVDASRISLPGPDIDAAMRELAVAVHGEGVSAAIDAALAKDATP